MMLELGGGIDRKCTRPSTIRGKDGENQDGVENIVVEVETNRRTLSECAGEFRDEVLGLRLREEAVWICRFDEDRSNIVVAA